MYKECKMVANKIKSFIERIKTKNESLTKPRFSKGQYIHNKEYQTFAKIENVWFNTKHGIDHATYNVKYLKNPKAIAMGITLEHTRMKKVKAIDAYYELADERVIAILFKGKNNE